MAKPKPDDDRKKRVPQNKEDKVEALKRRAEELCGGEMEAGSLDDYPEIGRAHV